MGFSIALPTRCIALSCASALVIASAGFGSVFAWQSGSQHGVLLGILSVTMAVALEGCKPLAVSGAFTALRSLEFTRGFALILLATAAIAYSLTAELALMAGSRGDLVAKRGAQVHSAEQARERYEDARKELTSLAPSRPVAEVQAEITKLLADHPKAGDCHSLDGPVSRTVCPTVALLKGEAARTERRTELQGVLARSTAVAGKDVVKSADPASSALAVYLALLGIVVSAATLSEYLHLVPVLALELGSALAVVLVSGTVQGSNRPAKTTPYVDQKSDSAYQSPPAQPYSAPAAPKPAAPSVATMDSPKPAKAKSKRKCGQPTTVTKSEAKLRLLDAMQSRGGKLDGSVRGLAKLIGGKKSTVQSAIVGMIGAGTVARVGSELMLN